MSKSSNNDNAFEKFIDQQKALDHYVDILENFNMKISTLSKTLEDSVTNIAKRELYIKDINNMSKVEIRDYFNTIKKTLSSMGIELTKEAEKMLKSAEKSAITSAQRTGNMSFENLNNKTVNNVLSDLFTIAEEGASKGQKSITIKDFPDNKTALNILKQINATLGKDNKLDTFEYKMKAFFGEKFGENKKAFKGFARDIIEGIASSKFVGGALGDLIKLGGLQLHNWLSQYGKVGQFLGKVVLVLSQILATLLSGSIISNILELAFGRKMFGWIGNAFKGGANLLKGIFKGGGFAKGVSAVASFFSHGPKTMTTQMAKSTLKAGTVFRDSATGGLRKVVEGAIKADGTRSLRTVAIKEAQQGASIFSKLGKFVPSIGKGALTVGKVGLGAVRGIPGLIGSLAATPLANKAVSMGANAYVAHGLSGAAQGALFGAMFGPIGAGIGAAIGGIAGLIKGHFAKQEKEQDESKNFWHELLDMLRNSKLGKLLGFGGEGGSYRGSVQQELGANATVEKSNRVFKSGTSVELLSGKHKSAVNEHLDIRKMTEADWRKADTLDPVYGSMGNILNLGKMSQKRAREVVEADIKAKGSKSFYEKLDKDLVSKGSFSTDIPYAARGTSAKVRDLLERAKKEGFDTSDVKITSAIGTLGSRNAVSPHSYTNSATGHFSEYGTTIDISDLRKKDGTRLTRADLKRMGLSDYYLYNNETDHADHEHLSLGKYAWMDTAKIENQQKQQVVAQKHSIDTIGLVAKLEGKEKAEEIGKAHLGDDKAFKEAYEKVLRDYGITHMTDSKGKERWYYHDNEQNVTKEFDPTGNLDALKKQMTYMTNNAQ